MKIDCFLIDFVVDLAPSKQGKYLPGSHIPILPPSALAEINPDFVLILPWNIAEEVSFQLKSLLSKGSQFVVAVPSLRIL